MNTKLLCMLAMLVAGLSLSGCRTMDESAYVAPPAKQVTPGTQYAPRIEENTAYMTRVESMASRRGITVHWVNKPVKRHVDQE
jgi:hypothetical protein